jgi:hypothetical protein
MKKLALLLIITASLPGFCFASSIPTDRDARLVRITKKQYRCNEQKTYLCNWTDTYQFQPYRRVWYVDGQPIEQKIIPPQPFALSIDLACMKDANTDQYQCRLVDNEDFFFWQDEAQRLKLVFAFAGIGLQSKTEGYYYSHDFVLRANADAVKKLLERPAELVGYGFRTQITYKIRFRFE